MSEFRFSYKVDEKLISVAACALPSPARVPVRQRIRLFTRLRRDLIHTAPRSLWNRLISPLSRHEIFSAARIGKGLKPEKDRNRSRAEKREFNEASQKLKIHQFLVRDVVASPFPFAHLPQPYTPTAFSLHIATQPHSTQSRQMFTLDYSLHKFFVYSLAFFQLLFN